MITVTSNAVNHIKKLLSSRGKETCAIKLTIETKGCSGLSYSMEFVDCPDEKDEVLNVEDVKIFIDPKATLFLLGTTMDYEEGVLESGFKFINPNEKADVVVASLFTSDT